MPMRRSVTAWQAALLPLMVTLVGVPLGIGAAAAMVLAGPPSESGGEGLAVPWPLVAGLVVVVPLVSGLGARLVAAVGGWRRPGLAAALALD